MGRLKLAFDLVNLALVIVGLILIVRKYFLMPRELFALDVILSPEFVTFSLGSFIGLLSVLTKKRVLGILALFLLTPSIYLVMAMPPSALYVYLHSNPSMSVSSGVVNVSSLREIEIRFSGEEGERFMYRIATSKEGLIPCVGDWRDSWLPEGEVYIGKIRMEGIDEVWFSACVWSIGSDWEYRLKGHAKRVEGDEYMVAVHLVAVEWVDITKGPSPSIVIPLVVSIIYTLTTSYISKRKGQYGS